jgi:hypothetical protein
MQINALFRPGSKELQKYLDKHKVGTKLKGDWEVTDVELDDDIPPDFSTGEEQVKVVITVTRPQEV